MIRASFLTLIFLLVPGCYINTMIPMDHDLDQTELGSKVGRASVKSVLWAVAWGDAGTQAAAAEGGLKTINHADREIFVVLGGVYARMTTVVYGD
jgi:hypothetical protein